ncbi:MAG: helix-turn-helix domain-containing protein [Bacteroidaceae bacterium]|nr:helix-turn-helix domain-containing protein [Bacteroidaceae bacterium]
MKQENKDRLLRLLQQYKALGIAEQIDFDKSYLDSIISNSVSLVDDDYGTVIDQSELETLTIEPSLAEKMVDILDFVAEKEEITTEAIVVHFGFTPTTANRYLRQLTEFGYLEAHGENMNRMFSKK